MFNRSDPARQALLLAFKATSTLAAFLLLSQLTMLAHAQPSAQLVWGECAARAPGEAPLCGTLHVPERRNEPDSTRLSLPFVILPALSPDPAPDPVVFLTGGPGYSALSTVTRWTEVRALREGRDVIIVEQRGNGTAIPALTCPQVRDARNRFDTSALEACRERLEQRGIHLDAYNSSAVAADLADLRNVLGLEEWNVFGTSYGTTVALTLLREHPQGIRSVVLDSPFPPQANAFDAFAAAGLNALGALFGACEAQPDCHEAYPNLKGKFTSATESLNARPIQVQGRTIDGRALYEFLFNALYDTSRLPNVPLAVHAAANGDIEMVLELLAVVPDLPPGIPPDRVLVQGSYLSVFCQEEFPYAKPVDWPLATTEEWSSPVQAAARFSMLQNRRACEVWGVPPAPPSVAQPVWSEVPTLVLAGEFDPVTPPLLAKWTLSTLPNATLLVAPATGHAVVVSPFSLPPEQTACPAYVTASFLDNPERPLDLSCVADMPSVDFVVEP